MSDNTDAESEEPNDAADAAESNETANAESNETANAESNETANAESNETANAESGTALGRARAATEGWFARRDPAERGVLAVTAIALLARLVLLGHHVMHYDEARVAYWGLYWTRTGTFHYQPIVHGPLVQHLDRVAFTLFGPTDFAARLPVALVGTLLPLSTLLYREHFSDGELVGMAFLLSASPMLLYYSRFLRSDLLLAALMFVALGFLVRLWDHRRPRDLYLATGFMALGLASKENMPVYLLCWVGMVAAVGGMELLYPRRFESRGAFVGAAADRGRSWVEWALGTDSRPWVARLVAAGALFLVVTIFLYAPRGYEYAGGRPQVGLFDPFVTSPGSGLWTTPFASTVDALQGIRAGFEYWTQPRGHTENSCYARPDMQPWLDDTFERGTFGYEYACYMGVQLTLLKKTALPMLVLSVVGFAEEWTSDRPRLLVTGAFAWGVASILGYPAGADILFPSWMLVHALVPLAVPAAVGLALLVRWGRESLADDDVVGAAIAVGAAALLVTSMAGVAAHHAYVAPQAGNVNEVNVAQYAQAEGEMRRELRTVRTVSRRNEGVDVIVYGSDFINPGGELRPACLKWLRPWAPVSWTLYAADAQVRCVESQRELQRVLERTNAPIVISSEAQSDSVGELVGDGSFVRTPGYQAYLAESSRLKVVFFFDTAQVDWSGNTTAFQGGFDA